jgi:hypothetical protein
MNNGFDNKNNNGNGQLPDHLCSYWWYILISKVQNIMQEYNALQNTYLLIINSCLLYPSGSTILSCFLGPHTLLVFLLDFWLLRSNLHYDYVLSIVWVLSNQRPLHSLTILSIFECSVAFTQLPNQVPITI